jgi:hypothetical protein
LGVGVRMDGHASCNDNDPPPHPSPTRGYRIHTSLCSALKRGEKLSHFNGPADAAHHRFAYHQGHLSACARNHFRDAERCVNRIARKRGREQTEFAARVNFNGIA